MFKILDIWLSINIEINRKCTFSFSCVFMHYSWSPDCFGYPVPRLIATGNVCSELRSQFPLRMAGCRAPVPATAHQRGTEKDHPPVWAAEDLLWHCSWGHPSSQDRCALCFSYLATVRLASNGTYSIWLVITRSLTVEVNESMPDLLQTRGSKTKSDFKNGLRKNSCIKLKKLQKAVASNFWN